MTVFEARPIKPEKMKVEVYERAVNTVLDKHAKIFKKGFESTQSTFRRKGPVLIKVGKFWRIIWVDSETYSYISHGTSIRWALMSRDWDSKTRPGRLSPGPGRGRVIIAGRRAMLARGIGPRRGIKGRKFDKQLVKKHGKPFQRDMQKEINRASQKLF